MTKSSDDYDGKHVKIKFNSDDELPLNKTMELLIFMKIINIIHNFFLDECLYKL